MFRRTINKVFFYLVFLSPFILFLMPANYFDHGDSTCLSVRLAGIECYACGMTRGVMHLMHFEFSKAWEYNKLTFLVVPVLSILWIRSVYEVRNKKIPDFLMKIM